jgi:hypothetical protein
VAAQGPTLHLVPEPAGAAPALASRVERLIAECIEMRERAALTPRSTRTLLREARQLLEEARRQRSRRAAPPLRPGSDDR